MSRQIAVLGPVLLRGDGDDVVLRGKQGALLALLAARWGRMVPTDVLIDALWPASLPADPKAAVQVQVFRLRRALSGCVGLESVPDGYRLDGPCERLDAARFVDLLARARAQLGEPAAAVSWLDEALGLWRGRPFGGAAEHEVVTAEAARLEEVRAEAALLRAELLIGLGRESEAVQAMTELAADHPLREGPVAIGMRALARAGRHAEALAAYADFRRRLGDGLGLEPSPALRAVQAEVLRHSAPAARRVPGLGLPGNSFLGREADLARVETALTTARLVTLTGPPGVGKTRLAFHAAVDAAAGYPDGVYVCEFARVRQGSGVAAALATSLRLGERADRDVPGRIVEFLQAQQALLVLDNCEHVLPEVAELAGAILARTAEIRLLATSRQRLGVPGEHRVRVDPLEVAGPQGRGPAGALFADRAREAGVELASDVADHVAELCQLLGGLPLAVEFAAASCTSRTVSETLAELRDRPGRLADPARALERHRSVEAVVGWSYDLLDPAERGVFDQLAVFAGGWTVAAAARVAEAEEADTADILAALVERSLVRAQDAGGHTRYTMLEPIRQFAHARLVTDGGLEGALARHAAWCVDLAARAGLGLLGAEEGRWQAELDCELANLRAAHHWCMENDPAGAIRIVAELFYRATLASQAEMYAWADATVARWGDDTDPYLAGAFATASWGAWVRGDLAGAQALAERAVTMARPDVAPRVAVQAWKAMGDTQLLAGELARALSSYDHAIALAAGCGETAEEAVGRSARAMALGYLGRTEEACRELAAVSAMPGAAQSPSCRAYADYIAGEIRLESAPAEALGYLRRARETCFAVGNTFIGHVAWLSEVTCAARLGDPAEHLDAIAGLLEHWRRARAWPQQWITIRALIGALAALGRYEPAAVLLGALTTSRSSTPISGADAERLDTVAAILSERFGQARLAALRAEGALLGDEPAAAYALAAARAAAVAR